MRSLGREMCWDLFEEAGGVGTDSCLLRVLAGRQGRDGLVTGGLRGGGWGEDKAGTALLRVACEVVARVKTRPGRPCYGGARDGAVVLPVSGEF